MRAILILLLEGYALFLAWFHSLAGVQTDEAKYLLNIPYPHPPLLRSIMAETASWPFQEMFWRVLLATLVVQAVWFVWDMTRGLPKPARLATCAAWILSPSILLQGGTVMLGPVTAVTALVMLWLLLKQRQGMAVTAETWGLLWAVALLTAYQGVTLLPLALAGAWKSDGSPTRRVMAALLPLVLLTMVTITNPLAVATMIIHADEGARMTFGEHAEGAAVLWFTAGAWVASLVGTLGLLLRPRWEVLGAFALTILFVLGSAPFPFYGILFLPFLVEGVRCVFTTGPHQRIGGAGQKNISSRTNPFVRLPSTFIALLIVGGLWMKPWNSIPTEPSLARTVMQEIAPHGIDGDIAISGSFGHQWEYESPLPVRRYVPGVLDGVNAIICLSDCIAPGSGWMPMEIDGASVWVRS